MGRGRVGRALSALPVGRPGGGRGDGPIAAEVRPIVAGDGVLAGRPSRTAGWLQAEDGGVADRLADVERAPAVEVDERAAKAAIYGLNSIGGRPSELEEAWIVQALVREDGLSQVEAAVLLNKHKSWVCRRLALLERLGAEAQADLRLGLLSPGLARQLTRLPVGNQAAILSTARRVADDGRSAGRDRLAAGRDAGTGRVRAARTACGVVASGGCSRTGP